MNVWLCPHCSKTQKILDQFLDKDCQRSAIFVDKASIVMKDGRAVECTSAQMKPARVFSPFQKGR